MNGGLDSGDNSRGSEDVELMVSYEEREDLLMDSMQSSKKKKVKNPNRQHSFGPSD